MMDLRPAAFRFLHHVLGVGALVGLVALGGCATTTQPVQVKHDDASGTTTYETARMRLDDVDMTEGLQKQNRFFVQVVGTCSGDGCAPSEYAIHFIKDGPQPVQLGGRDVAMTIGSETITWEDPQTRDASQTTTVRSGIFARIKVSSGQLSTIGGVAQVSGAVGGTNFSIPYEQRRPIRTLLKQIEGDTADSAS